MTSRNGRRLASEWSVVDGVKMHARVAPGGARRPRVVLVHGLLLSSRYMVPLAERLAPDCAVWAPDMPGFGRSDDPPDVPDVSALAGWLGRWIETADLTDVTVVANSFGCQYAVDLVANDPTRISGLVLTGPTMDPRHRTAIRQAARWIANALREPASLGLVMVRDLMACSLRRLLITYRHGLRDAIETKLPQITVPTVIARGERDLLVPQRWAEEATGLLPDGRLEVVAGAAHTLNYNSPDAIAEIIRRASSA